MCNLKLPISSANRKLELKQSLFIWNGDNLEPLPFQLEFSSAGAEECDLQT